MDEKILKNKNKLLKWSSSCNKYTVYISYDCINSMLDIAKNYYPNEIGSQLIGLYSDDGFEAFITDITPITIDTKTSKNSFFRGTKGLRNFFKKLNKSFNNQFYYIGEWHSHPNGLAEPSSIDDNSQFAIINDNNLCCPENILVIIGGKFTRNYKLGIFVYSKKYGKTSLIPFLTHN
ncbi:MAG: Mov34/MPN/PAD-1 family protein [Candidatus Eremiobacterota bacterium]